MGGAYLSSPDRKKTTILGENKAFVYAASDVQGWRRVMEDTHILVCDLVTDVSVFGVFDGHGGQTVALIVKEHFIEELQRNKNFQNQKFEDALRETFLKMDELIFEIENQKQLNQADEGYDCCGCTANVALIHKNTLYVANAGDSRSLLCRNNISYEMSFDHKPDNWEEKERIEKAGGYIEQGRINGNIAISRALGDLEYKKQAKLKQNEQLIIALPDIQKVVLTRQDQFLLMGCDGVFDTLSISDLFNFINQKLEYQPVTPSSLGRVAEDLLDQLIGQDVSTGIGCDNMTTIIIYFKGN